MTFNRTDYQFFDLTQIDHTEMSEEELTVLLNDTKEALSLTKDKTKNTPLSLQLAGGILAARGGEFIRINAFTGAKWKKGNTTKEEQALLKKVFSKARGYYFLRMFIALLGQHGEQQILNPTLVKKTTH